MREKIVKKKIENTNIILHNWKNIMNKITDGTSAINFP